MTSLKRPVLAGVPLIFALINVLVGKDANWDFLNYRWYDAWSLLHGRLETDVLVANHATFYNPLLELPFYELATHLPAVLAGFLLALAGTITFVPLFLLAEQGLPSLPVRYRVAIPTLIGLAGLLGGGVLGQIGIVSWDLPLGTLTLFALYILVREDAACLRLASRHSTYALLLAGFLAGSAAGFKLTAAIYPVGLVAGIAIASTLPGLRRLWQIVLFSAGVGIGMAVFGGYWMARLYSAFGNPFFPYFNGLFHSDFAAAGSNRDTTFLPQDWLTAVFFPYFFSADSHRVAEYDFRDIHIALVFTLLPILIIARLWRRPAIELVQPVAAKFLLISVSVSYIAWEALFSIYRYIIPLEALAPLLIVLAVALLPLSVRFRVAIAVACLLLGLLAIKVDFTRRAWGGPYVAIDLPFEVPANALILMTGDGPMGYAATALPPTVPVLRVTSYLVADTRFAERIRQEIEGQAGPYFALLPPGQQAASQQALNMYRLKLDPAGCGEITANIADPLLLCRVSR